MSTTRNRGKGDPLAHVASQVVVIAEAEATGLLVPLLDDHPDLREVVDRVGIETWDFVLTAAGVLCALRILQSRVSAERFRQLYEIPFDRTRTKPVPTKSGDAITQYMLARRDRWFQQGEAAVHDCLQFVEQVMGERERDMRTHAYAVGQWVLWKLLHRAPDQSQAQLASKIGGLLAQTFLEWWGACGDG